MISITILKKADAKALKEIRILLLELRSDMKKISGTLAELQTIASDPNVVFCIAKDGSRIVGMGVLYIVRKVGRSQSHIEDVVVLREYRGQGIGTALLKKLIAVARPKRVDMIELTSNPRKTAANKLYQKLGFKRRETNVYKITL